MPLEHVTERKCRYIVGANRASRHPIVEVVGTKCLRRNVFVQIRKRHECRTPVAEAPNGLASRWDLLKRKANIMICNYAEWAAAKIGSKLPYGPYDG